MSTCSGFSRPTGGETLYRADNFTISWPGGTEFNIIPLRSNVCTFRLQFQFSGLQRIETIVDELSITYNTTSWYPIDLGCSNADTQMSYNWTIPRILKLTDSDLTRGSILFTNLTTDKSRVQLESFSSNQFNIKAATTTTSGTGPTNTITTTSPTPTPEPSLSTGAKAGIGVGAAFVVLCCALGAWIFVKRKKKTTVASEIPAEERNSGYVKAELDASETQQRAELDAQQSGTHAAQELDTRHEASERDPVELP